MKQSLILRVLNVTTELSVAAYFWKRVGREGSGCVEDQGKRNILVKRWKWRGLTLWKRVIDTEDVPTQVWVDSGTLGFYDGP